MGRPDGAEGDGRRHRRAQGTFDGITAQGGDTGVVQAMIDAKHPFVPFGGETENGFRKFCAQVCGRRAEVLVGRHRPGPGRGRHQDGDRRARGPGRAAVGEAAARHRRGSGLQGRPGLLSRPVRQLLRRQFLPDLRHQLHRAGNHGPDEGKPSNLVDCARRRGRNPAAPFASGHPGRAMDGREPLRSSAWRASRSAMAACGRWRRPS